MLYYDVGGTIGREKKSCFLFLGKAIEIVIRKADNEPTNATQAKVRAVAAAAGSYLLSPCNK